MRTILVPLDGSALAEQIIPLVRLYAPLLGAGVHLTRIVPHDAVDTLVSADLPVQAEPGGSLASGWARSPLVQTLFRRHAEHYLETCAAQLRVAGLKVATTIQVGPPAESILELASQPDIAMVAMTTNGYSGLRRWTTGSVARQVVRAAQVPVLIVRCVAPDLLAAPDLRLTRALVALDGSALARQALPLAVELAVQARAELVLLQAVAPTIEYTDVLAIRHEQAATELDDLAAAIRREHGVAVTAVVALNSAAEAIVGEAEQRRAELIVMATQGQGGLRRLVLGSVADRVLHTTPTPLLLVRARTAA